MVMRLITAVVYWQRKVKRGGDNEPRPSAEKKQHQLTTGSLLGNFSDTVQIQPADVTLYEQDKNITKD